MFSTSENNWGGQRLDAPEAVDLLAGFVGDLIAGFQIIVLQMAFQVAAYRPLSNRPVTVVLAPQLVDGVQLPGGFSNLWSHGGFFTGGVKGFIFSMAITKAE